MNLHFPDCLSNWGSRLGLDQASDGTVAYDTLEG
jgi:hypothetical protein